MICPNPNEDKHPVDIFTNIIDVPQVNSDKIVQTRVFFCKCSFFLGAHEYVNATEVSEHIDIAAREKELEQNVTKFKNSLNAVDEVVSKLLSQKGNINITETES